MIHMLEVVGISNMSFSDAVKSAVKKLLEGGNKLYWFEIVEQRGAVKGNEIEYQVKLKVAAEAK
ncbi:MAG: dodecin family protein [candidate division KSB1 bacterium]|nr:dodecin family protein [candidate division KSB1 bacterium]MDZ7340226.1 dodecin family protein [candidate division KSB1 bacterium]